MIKVDVVDDTATTGDPAASRSRVWWFAAAGIALAVWLLYARTIHEGLYLDDQHHVRPWSLGEVFGTFHGPFDPLGLEPAYFRPLVVVTFALDWAAWGWDPIGYHITNVALHAVAVVMVLILLRKLELSLWMSAAGALLFGAIPANVATAVYISERSDAMVAIFTILGALCAVRYSMRRQLTWLILLNLCYVLAIGTKEVGIAMILSVALIWWFLQLSPPTDRSDERPPLSVIAHWRNELRAFTTPFRGRRQRREWLRVLGPMTVVALIAVIYRAAVLPTGALGERYSSVNPIRAVSRAILDTFAGVPWELSGRTLPILAMLLVLAFLADPRSRAWRLVVLGVAWVVATCVPLAYLGQVEPRLLYVAQIGVAIVFAAALTIIVGAVRARQPGVRRLLVALPAGLLVLAFAALTLKATTDAQDLFAPGSDKMLGKDLEIWTNDETRDRWPAHHLQLIRERLQEAGVIDADGAVIDGGSGEG